MCICNLDSICTFPLVCLPPEKLMGQVLGLNLWPRPPWLVPELHIPYPLAPCCCTAWHGAYLQLFLWTSTLVSGSFFNDLALTSAFLNLDFFSLVHTSWGSTSSQWETFSWYFGQGIRNSSRRLMLALMFYDITCTYWFSYCHMIVSVVLGNLSWNHFQVFPCWLLIDCLFNRGYCTEKASD